jgi:molecular chaperone HtpG
MKRMHQMAKQMGNEAMFPIKKTLVINPANPLIQNALKLSEKGKNDLVKKICHHVEDLAHISSEGLKHEDREAFVHRSQSLIEELSNLAL